MPGSWEMFILEVHFLPAERPRGGRDVIFEEVFVYQTYSHPDCYFSESGKWFERNS